MVICVLYAHPDVILSRIAAAPLGRPIPTQWEAQFHSDLQGMVAVAYATRLGIPVYLLDSNRPVGELAADIIGYVDKRHTNS